MEKVVGHVTQDECKEIQYLYERRNGLNELAKIIDLHNEDLYKKVVADMGETTTKFQNWWDRMLAKYKWEEIEGGHWEINFENGEIVLYWE